MLQQIDTPQNLYNTPDNLFVAGFIGSPAMNFFPATLVREDGKLYADGGSVQVQIRSDRAGKGGLMPRFDRGDDIAVPYLPTEGVRRMISCRQRPDPPCNQSA